MDMFGLWILRLFLLDRDLVVTWKRPRHDGICFRRQIETVRVDQQHKPASFNSA
jgi:hypothetical protein